MQQEELKAKREEFLALLKHAVSIPRPLCDYSALSSVKISDCYGVPKGEDGTVGLRESSYFVIRKVCFIPPVFVIRKLFSITMPLFSR